MLLVLIDPGQAITTNAAVVRDLFGLTAAESDLAVRLGRGERVQAIAQARGVGVGTVRTQLRTIFGKTRTNSQAGLVLLLARLTTVQSTT
jgi:DNA-binding CsgD family transcriptional regulator